MITELAPRDRALSSGAALWGAIAASPELARVGALAEAATFTSGGNRGTGEAFEKHLAGLLTATVQVAITADVRAALPGGVPGSGQVVDVSWIHGGPRRGFDFAVMTSTADGDLRTDWVNVKRVGELTGSAEACALNTAIRAARGEDLGRPGRVNIPRMLLRWFAGREKIAGADYRLLEFVCERGALRDVRTQGLLSSVSNNRLAMRIHSNRDVVQYTPSEVVLPDDFDVNAAFPEALTRTPSADDLRLGMLAFASEQLGLDRGQVAAMAATLDDADDTAVAKAVLAALGSLVGS